MIVKERLDRWLQQYADKTLKEKVVNLEQELEIAHEEYAELEERTDDLEDRLELALDAAVQHKNSAEEAHAVLITWLACILLKNGGELVVSKETLDMVNGSNVGVNISDKENGDMVLKLEYKENSIE